MSHRVAPVTHWHLFCRRATDFSVEKENYNPTQTARLDHTFVGAGVLELTSDGFGGEFCDSVTAPLSRPLIHCPVMKFEHFTRSHSLR